jgi:hypothetical protein
MKITETVICIGALAISFLAGYWWKEPVEKIKIVKETKTEFKYIKIATTIEELQKCYDSKLDIFADVKQDNWIQITAKDMCKVATKSIHVVPESKRNCIYLSAGMNNYYQFMYYRKFGNFQLGTGISYPGNIHVGIGYNF